MTSTDLWQFVRTHGLGGGLLVFLLLGVFLLFVAVYGSWQTLHTPRKDLTYGSVVTPLGSLLLGAFFLFGVWAGLRERYLLQRGDGRYTVATVYKHKRWRGKWQVVYRYFVNGQAHVGEHSCGVKDWQEVPCPLLGSRYYVYFSPDHPDAVTYTDIYVPDSVRTIPPLGWARIP